MNKIDNFSAVFQVRYKDFNITKKTGMKKGLKNGDFPHMEIFVRKYCTNVHLVNLLFICAEMYRQRCFSSITP